MRQPPIQVVELELSEPIPDLKPTVSPEGIAYRQALVLVRLHREPLGLLPVDLPDTTLRAGELAHIVWSRLHPQIARHLADDCQPQMWWPPASGPREAAVPPCAWEQALQHEDLPLVSVVVTTCDRPFQLRRTLRSLLAQTYPTFEIIVVDNRPGERSSGTAGEPNIGDPRIRYIEEQRAGLSAARNAGLAEASGTFVAFTDDDVTVDRHWLASLTHAFLRDQAVACVTGLILPLELETSAQLLFEQFGGFGKGFRRRSFDLGPNRPPDPLFPYTAGRFGSGANTAFRTSLLRAIGGFAVELGAGTPAHGGEDLDAYLNVIHSGHRLVYEPRAMLWHPHRLDLPGLSKQIHRYGVGLGAALAKRLLTGHDERRQILRRLPAGLAYAVHPRSPKNSGKGPSYPARLTVLELAGMLRGPIAYGAARRLARAAS